MKASSKCFDRFAVILKTNLIIVVGIRDSILQIERNLSPFLPWRTKNFDSEYLEPSASLWQTSGWTSAHTSTCYMGFSCIGSLIYKNPPIDADAMICRPCWTRLDWMIFPFMWSSLSPQKLFSSNVFQKLVRKRWPDCFLSNLIVPAIHSESCTIG